MSQPAKPVMPVATYLCTLPPSARAIILVIRLLSEQITFLLYLGTARARRSSDA